MPTPNIPTPASLVLLSKVFNKFNINMQTELDWLDYAFGQVERITKNIGGKDVSIPAVYAGTNIPGEYQSVLPDEWFGGAAEIKGYSFIDYDEADLESQSPRVKGIIDANVSMIFWFNVDQVLNSASEYRNIDFIIRDILSAVRNSNKGFQGSIQVTNWTTKSGRIFNDYSVSHVDSQFLMHPFGGVKLELNVRAFEGSCSDPDYTISPLTAFSYPSAQKVQNVDQGNAITNIVPVVTGNVKSYVLPLGDTLPSGLSLNPSTGVISGTPTEMGLFNVCAISRVGQIIGVQEVSIRFTGAGVRVNSILLDSQTQYDDYTNIEPYEVGTYYLIETV